MSRVDLIFATSNQNKAEEVAQLLDFSWLNVLTLKQIGYTTEIEETGSTLEENAQIKSEAIFSFKPQNIFAEDTGLEVYALNMEPGVHTARYAGPSRDAHENMNKLLNALENKEDRRARFRTALSLIWENKRYMFEGIVEGQIAEEKTGDGGFGYDPIFIPDGYVHSFGTLPSGVKNRISHRGRAVAQLKAFLSNIRKA